MLALAVIVLLVALSRFNPPLDPSFAEQKKILQRCGGLFHACAGGAEARLFNRLLIDAGAHQAALAPRAGPRMRPAVRA